MGWVTGGCVFERVSECVCVLMGVMAGNGGLSVLCVIPRRS